MEAYSAREWEPSEITVRQSGQVKYERVTGIVLLKDGAKSGSPGIYHSSLDPQFHFRNWYELKYWYNPCHFKNLIISQDILREVFPLLSSLDVDCIEVLCHAIPQPSSGISAGSDHRPVPRESRG